MDGVDGGLVASVATELARLDAAEAAEAAAAERATALRELREELGHELRPEAEARWLEMGAAVQATGRRVEALETALGAHAARQADAAAAQAQAAKQAQAQRAQQVRGLDPNRP